MCSSLQSIEWTKSDTKEGITVARSKFGRSSKGYAVMKVEGTLPANPRNVFNFLQLSTKEGGKVSFIIIMFKIHWKKISSLMLIIGCSHSFTMTSEKCLEL